MAGESAHHRSDVTSRAATVNARKAIKIERAVRVNRPSSELYEIWRDFSNVPRFMEHIESVQCADEMHSHWIARLPAGTHVEWDAEIVNDVPGTLIAWKTIGDPDVAHAGSVHFTPTADSAATEVRLVFDYEPPFAQTIASIASHAGLTGESLVDSDLRGFKEYAEAARAD